MAQIKHTPLPGLGERRDFVTESGDRIGIISHRDGTRELVFYEHTDPDRCRVLAKMSAEDLRQLTQLCGES